MSAVVCDQSGSATRDGMCQIHGGDACLIVLPEYVDQLRRVREAAWDLVNDCSWTNKATDGEGHPLYDVHGQFVYRLRAALTGEGDRTSDA